MRIKIYCASHERIIIGFGVSFFSSIVSVHKIVGNVGRFIYRKFMSDVMKPFANNP